MSKVTKSVIMSEAHSEIYNLNICMQEMKSSYKRTPVKTVWWLFYFFTFIPQTPWLRVKWKHGSVVSHTEERYKI